MKEKPHPIILDRNAAVQAIKEHFSETTELTQELANYGSNLITRCFASSKRTLTDIVVLGGLLKQVIAMLDAVEILVSQGAVYAAHVPARVLFEAYLYIQWILREDHERRARQYYAWQIRQERMWARRVTPGTDEHKGFSKILETFDFPQDGAPTEVEVTKRISEIDELLATEKYKDINAEFEKLRRGRHDPPWYKPSGPSSLADMAERLGLRGQYELFYAQLSQITHAEAFGKQIGIGANEISFKSVRHLEGIRPFLLLVLSLSMNLYRIILGHYREGELSNFSKKYVEEWRTRFLSIKDVRYTFQNKVLI